MPSSSAGNLHPCCWAISTIRSQRLGVRTTRCRHVFPALQVLGGYAVGGDDEIFDEVCVARLGFSTSKSRTSSPSNLARPWSVPERQGPT